MDQKTKARRARVRLAVMGVAVTAAVTAGAVLALSLGDDDQPSDPPAAQGEETTEPEGDGGSSEEMPSATPDIPYEELTPATAPPVELLSPASTEAGIGTGFEHSGLGAESAAVAYWEGLDVLDDVLARRQLTAITSQDSPQSIDNRVSDVRQIREEAGLAPSGGAPPGISVSTTVEAIVSRSLDETGDVVAVWMVFDRYVIESNQTVGGEVEDASTWLIVKWENGDWRLTDEPQYVEELPGPRAYSPDSTYAFQDGWREVSGG